MTLELLLIVAFGGAFLTYFLGKISSSLRNGFAVLNALALVVMTAFLYGQTVEKNLHFGFLGMPFVLRINMLSWFFAITIVGIGLLSIIYSLKYIENGKKLDFYYFTTLLINASMLGTVICGDLISFYMFWEIMSWSTYLLISYKGGDKALFAGIKYIIMSIIGSLAMLVGIISLYTHFGTLEISTLAIQIQGASLNYILFILIMFSTAFIIINAFWPLHIWLPDAHAEAVSPFSSILSAVLVRKGMYGLYLFMYVILGLNILNRLKFGFISFTGVFCWIGAITIVFAALTALLQNDSKRILAWSTVGQGGYMILGVAFVTPLGMAGGTFHILNHCIYIALLFFVAGAIEYRTGGIRDLNSLGGLIKKMPVTFIGGLVGIFGLIGLPLTNGFVSKWLIYKTLILGNRPFLAFAAFLGTWGTVLYGYKFIHNIFLGQLPEKYKNIKEVPFTMRIPIIILTILVFLFGILPGIPLKVINAIGISLGFESLDVTLWGIASETGTLNTINIFAAILIVGIIIWLIFKAGRKAPKVDQYDNYAAGSAIPKNKYNYTVDYYYPFTKMISPYLKDIFDLFYTKIANTVQKLCNSTRKIYTGYVGSYVMYIVLFLAILILVQLKWGVF
ncbi:MAG: proton-conducting transporter membrane subunit [Candidatus Celaenobacter antarcticus]|nr:proton-conducting transporter membrane subunit [Candidatus Celaenobacter antarcticus]